MAIPLVYRPIDLWPGQLTRSRRPSPFEASYARTLQDLDRELLHLGARQAVLQLAIREAEVRRDGQVYANARPDHPGVILSFKSRLGDLRYPCDTFTAWQENLRAIALALAALRAVDRYGVTRRAEQYRGWTALPGPIVTPERMRPEDAAQFLACQAAPLVDQITDADLRMKTKQVGASTLLKDPNAVGYLYRLAAKRLHPDANGGQELPEWKRLQDAAEILRKHHGL